MKARLLIGVPCAAILTAAVIVAAPRSDPAGQGGGADDLRPVSRLDFGAVLSTADLATLSAGQLTAVVPPDEPTGSEAEEDCAGSKDAFSTAGRTYNRFLWCQFATIEFSIPQRYDGGDLDENLRKALRDNGAKPGVGGSRSRRSRGDDLAPDLPAPNAGVLMYKAFAFGRSAGGRSVRVFLQPGPVGYWSLGAPGLGTEAHEIEITVSCGNGDACAVGTDKALDMSVAAWRTDDDWYSWTVTSDGADVPADPTTNPDRVGRFGWWFKADLDLNRLVPRSLPRRHREKFAVPLRLGGKLDAHRVRCDSATYFPGKDSDGACVFDDVVPHLMYSRNDRRIKGVSEHLACAFDPASCRINRVSTPGEIPGHYGHSTQALHRIPSRKENDKARQDACATARPSPSTGMSCDEYPFASTWEGAANPRYGLSVHWVDARQNSCAGNFLNQFYIADRILQLPAATRRPDEAPYSTLRPDQTPSADPFFVEIIDTRLPSSGKPTSGKGSCDYSDTGAGWLQPQSDDVAGGTGVLEPDGWPTEEPGNPIEGMVGGANVPPEDGSCGGVTHWQGIWGGAYEATYPTTANNTWDTDCHLSPNDVWPGVWLLQEAYNACYASELGLPELTADGVYGPATEAAVGAIQEHEGVEVDGVYGPGTQQQMDWPNQSVGDAAGLGNVCKDNSEAADMPATDPEGQLEPTPRSPSCTGTTTWTGVWGGDWQASYPTTSDGSYDADCELREGRPVSRLRCCSRRTTPATPAALGSPNSPRTACTALPPSRPSGSFRSTRACRWTACTVQPPGRR